jgi:hypothetical protein
VRVGALVKIKWSDGTAWAPAGALGVVRDYRLETLGGSGVSSWRDDNRKWQAEITTTSKRGEVLVLCYEDGSMSWYDELNVELVPEE